MLNGKVAGPQMDLEPGFFIQWGEIEFLFFATGLCLEALAPATACANSAFSDP